MYTYINFVAERVVQGTDNMEIHANVIKAMWAHPMYCRQDITKVNPVT